MNWWKGLRGKVRFKEPLSNKTAFKIGGRAKFFIQPKDIFDLKSLICSAKKIKIPVMVIGAGSNILASDKGINKIVLRLDLPFFKGIFRKGNYLAAGSGAGLTQLIKESENFSLSGLEFLAGIPGTVGGALSMNAGAWGKSISDLVETVSIMDYNGDVKVLRKKDIGFGYRKSGLGKYIILSACLKLSKNNKKKIRGSIKKYLQYRRLTQDSTFPNAGCIFKNPAGNSAGKLIDLCGLKGAASGGACVSMRHANFILNRKCAKAEDVLKLMGLIKRSVKQKFNIDLEPEIKIWQ
jgi:UDP-N-acetylmuramate dehydrogenase